MIKLIPKFKITYLDLDFKMVNHISDYSTSSEIFIDVKLDPVSGSVQFYSLIEKKVLPLQ
jgi:hypothetical protein